jgi:hemerythrin
MKTQFEWSDKFLSGFKIIDDQHRGFIDTINRLFSSLQGGNSKEDLDAILGELIEYSKVHFETEEVLLKKHNYPGLDDHIVSHRIFQDTTKEIEMKIEKKLIAIDYKLLDFLEEWSRNHLAVEDAKYTKYLKELGVAEY